MPSRPLVSVEEYVHSSYDPDCDYGDGASVERNVGELDHSDLQSEIVTYFRARNRKPGIYAFAEQRVPSFIQALSHPRCVHCGWRQAHRADLHPASIRRPSKSSRKTIAWRTRRRKSTTT